MELTPSDEVADSKSPPLSPTSRGSRDQWIMRHQEYQQLLEKRKTMIIIQEEHKVVEGNVVPMDFVGSDFEKIMTFLYVDYSEGSEGSYSDVSIFVLSIKKKFVFSISFLGRFGHCYR